MTIRSRLKQTFGIAEVEPETRKAAVETPGPTWGEYFRGSFSKAYLALGFFIADILIILSGLQPPDVLVVPAFVLAVYLEFLTWRYLWYRPDPDKESRMGTFEPTIWRPVRFGRWTPEGDRARAGIDPFGNERVGPDPDEFL